MAHISFTAGPGRGATRSELAENDLWPMLELLECPSTMQLCVVSRTRDRVSDAGAIRANCLRALRMHVRVEQAAPDFMQDSARLAILERFLEISEQAHG